MCLFERRLKGKHTLVHMVNRNLTSFQVRICFNCPAKPFSFFKLRSDLFVRQVERGWPAGGAPVPPDRAGVPAEPDGGDPQPHGSSEQGPEPASGPAQAPAGSIPTAAAAAGL